MSDSNKVLQYLSIPYSALITVIFGLMLMSFPIGVYLVFNSEIGEDITHEYPLSQVGIFLAGVGFEIPADYELGDGFILVWASFVILFAISMIGPKKNFLTTLVAMMSEGKYNIQDNYIATIIKWFSVLVIVSAIIAIIQGIFGIQIESPQSENDLVQFFDISFAPIIEEIGFRVLLIGLPLFAIFSHKMSGKFFIKSLWNPFGILHVYDEKRAWVIIFTVGIFFGLAHILTGDAWSEGKFAQAAASGIILGFVYFRYGFLASVLVHWASNYFIFSYANFVSVINEITIEEAFVHPLLSSLEMILIATGILSVAIMVISFFYKRNSSYINVK